MHDWTGHFELMREFAARLWNKLNDGHDPTFLLREYGRFRMYTLAPQARKIVANLHLEHESDVQGLARVTRIPENAISSQMQRLVQWRYVSRLVNETNRRRSVYRIEDPILDNALALNYHPKEWKPLDVDTAMNYLRMSSQL